MHLFGTPTLMNMTYTFRGGHEIRDLNGMSQNVNTKQNIYTEKYTNIEK